MTKIMSNSKERLNDKAQRFSKIAVPFKNQQLPIITIMQQRLITNPKNILLCHHAIMTSWRIMS